jgi:hypothetical protein
MVNLELHTGNQKEKRGTVCRQNLNQTQELNRMNSSQETNFTSHIKQIKLRTDDGDTPKVFRRALLMRDLLQAHSSNHQHHNLL